MTTLTDKFTALETDINDNQTAMMASLSGIADTLSLLNTAVDTLNNNQATNTRYLLAAIGQNSPCAPCPTPSVLVPPVATGSTPVSSDKCKRAQAMLQMLEAVCEALDNLMALNVPGAWTLISDVFSQIISTLGAGDTIPLPSFAEAVNIAGDYFSFAAARLFSGENLSTIFSAVRDDCRDAIYNAATPAAAQSAYNAVIDASSMSGAGKLLLKALAYNALWSYWLDPATTPVLTGFDGSACAITGCTLITSSLTGFASDGNGEAIVWPGPIVATDHTPASYFTTLPVWATTDLVGWSFTCTVDVLVVPNWAFSSVTVHAGTLYTFGHTDHAVIYNFPSTTPFTINLCPPA